MNRIIGECRIGGSIPDAIKNTCLKASLSGQQYTLPYLNGVTVDVDPDSDPERLCKDWEFAMAHDIKVVPAQGLNLCEQEVMMLKKIHDLKNQKWEVEAAITRAEDELKEWRVNQELKNYGLPDPFEMTDPDAYYECKGTSSLDSEYNKYIFTLAERWAALYELRSAARSGKDLVKEVDTDVCYDCTGFQHSCMRLILEKYWKRYPEVAEYIKSL